jgi:hypothetical protein
VKLLRCRNQELCAARKWRDHPGARKYHDIRPAITFKNPFAFEA